MSNLQVACNGLSVLSIDVVFRAFLTISRMHVTCDFKNAMWPRKMGSICCERKTHHISIISSHRSQCEAAWQDIVILNVAKTPRDAQSAQGF